MLENGRDSETSTTRESNLVQTTRFPPLASQGMAIKMSGERRILNFSNIIPMAPRKSSKRNHFSLNRNQYKAFGGLSLLSLRGSPYKGERDRVRVSAKDSFTSASLPFGRGSRGNSRGSRVNGRGSRVEKFFTIIFERRQIKI